MKSFALFDVIQISLIFRLFWTWENLWVWRYYSCWAHKCATLCNWNFAFSCQCLVPNSLTSGFPPTSARPAPKTGGFALRLVAWEVKPLRLPRKMMKNGWSTDNGRNGSVPELDCFSSTERKRVPTKQDGVIIDQVLATSLLLTLTTVPNSWLFAKMTSDISFWCFGSLVKALKTSWNLRGVLWYNFAVSESWNDFRCFMEAICGGCSRPLVTPNEAAKTLAAGLQDNGHLLFAVRPWFIFHSFPDSQKMKRWKEPDPSDPSASGWTSLCLQEILRWLWHQYSVILLKHIPPGFTNQRHWWLPRSFQCQARG